MSTQTLTDAVAIAGPRANEALAVALATLGVRARQCLAGAENSLARLAAEDGDLAPDDVSARAGAAWEFGVTSHGP
jgi:hypothetical protein